MKKLSLIIGILMLNLIVIGGSCQKSAKPFDSSGNVRIANETGKYLNECPSFFIPPYPDDPFADPTKQNQSGAVAWTPNGLTGPFSNGELDLETKDRYINKLNLQTVQNQNNWNQYQAIEGRGFPGYEEYKNGPQHPDAEFQAGFVCFALVRRAVNDAGFDPWEGFILITVGALSYNLPEITDFDYANVGDIVLFDWENDGTRDHAGIIVEKIGDGSNIKNWKIVSSIGTGEIFEGGAKKTRLGVFGTTNGGEFTQWNPAGENWVFQIYGVPTN